MKLGQFLLSGAMATALGLMTIGCNENPTDLNPGDSTTVGAPTSLQVTSLSETSVRLKWAGTTATDSVRVTWATTQGTLDSGSVTTAAGASTYTATGLQSRRAYSFTVRNLRGTAQSTPVSIVWAGATRYDTEANGVTTLRLYETASQFGSGLSIDGYSSPRNLSVKATSDPGAVQLAMYTTGSAPGTFDFGAAYAFDEYKAGNQFDRTVFLSDTNYIVNNLNEWYDSRPLNTLIVSATNAWAYTLPISSTTGRGFVVRTGEVGNYNYARVVVKSVGGKLLQGSGNDRYVELEISYQKELNLPYAKTGRGTLKAGGVGYGN